MTTPKKKVGRPAIWDEHAPEMARLYTEEELSQGEIARRYETSVQTVGRMLRKQGIEPKPRVNTGKREPLSEAHKAAISASRQGKGVGPRKVREKRSCAACGGEFEYRPGQSGERFCSRSCRNTGQAHDLRAEARAAYDADPKRCPCGQPITYEQRHNATYCSPACRLEHGKKKQADPTKQVTFACETCGDEVTRYKGYGSGANRFCSNLCAAKHTKKVRHYVIRESDMVLDSTWEMLFAGLMGFRKVSCERVNRETHTVLWAPDRAYAPDFLVTIDGLSIGIEVKGQEDTEDQQKWDAWRERYGPLLVIDEARLDSLCAGTPYDVRKRLYRWATE